MNLRNQILRGLTLSALVFCSGRAQPEPTITVTPAQPARAVSAENFTGQVKLQPLFGALKPGRTSSGLVTFEPGARSAWHTHPLGQALVVTAGEGWVQNWGGPVQTMKVGQVVQIPAGVKHWHGATAYSTVSHIAIQEEIDGRNVDWLEKVSDQQYPSKQESTASPQTTAFSKTYGEFSPKLAELTDKVLFGDIWERPQLSKRDRSLVTVSALIAGGNTEQLTSHLQRAVDNGLTKEQLVEAITHLAFYTGWPRALSALAVARQVFEKSKP